MDEFLTPAKVTVKGKGVGPAEVTPHIEALTRSVSTSQDVLEVLRSQPSIDELLAILQFLNPKSSTETEFRIADPGPLSSQIIFTLVNSTVPDYWNTLETSKPREKGLLVKILRSVSGIGALIARLRLLNAESEQKKSLDQRENTHKHIVDILAVLDAALEGNETSQKIWYSLVDSVKSDTKRMLAWKEYILQVAGGKVLSAAAQADQVLGKSKNHQRGLWIASGEPFAAWLGRNIAVMLSSTDDANSEIWIAATKLCGKSLSLGYKNKTVTEIYTLLYLSSQINEPNMSKWICKLQGHEQRSFLDSTLSSSLPALIGSEDYERTPLKPSTKVSGAATLIRNLISESTALKDILATWLSKGSSQSYGGGISVVRAAVSALSMDEDRLHSLAEKLIAQFGDSLYIKHTPILNHEGLAQTLLLCCGYIHRAQPMALFMIARSSPHMNSVSNRLAASSPRARFLGMAIGKVISELVDKPENAMKFEFNEAEQEEIEWLRQLTQIDDKLGDIKALRSSPSTWKNQRQGKKSVKKAPAEKLSPIGGQTQPSGPRIVEILDESDDDDLIPYAKPDSDPEDESDDPTVLQRNKPTAPVYVRDLISSIRDTENYDRHTLALKAAPALIRRKANFGKEVTDHLDELVTIFIGLTDHFEIDQFHELRQQALIAILLAQPARIGQYFARSYFEGEYSISQRLAILTAMGLGTRELAGFDDFEQDPNIKAASKAFPSKRLPPHLHKIYAEESSPVAALSKRLESMMIQPMAVEAADKAAGPNALKVRTFSSRMEVEKKRKKPIANELAKIVAQNFFFPLTGRWWSHIQAYGPSTMQATPHLLPTYLRTLALLLHSSGPSTLSLPSMTSEFWDLLLSLRTIALSDITILEALLFSLLTLLEVNEDRQQIAQDHPKELLETQIWVKGVWEGMGKGSEGNEDERVRMLAASVLVRSQEIVEKYQRMLMGDMMTLDS